jgi:hypothetical protein
MTDFYNIKDKKVQCGICGEWINKDDFVVFSGRTKETYACCKKCSERFLVTCNHTGTTRTEIGRTTVKAWEDKRTRSYTEWEYEEERVICNLCDGLISSNKIRKRYNYHSPNGVKYGSWESC